MAYIYPTCGMGHVYARRLYGVMVVKCYAEDYIKI